MIGDRGEQDSEEDRDWPLKARRENHRKKLRFVADLGDGNDRR
jgi:hypothetical protein